MMIKRRRYIAMLCVLLLAAVSMFSLGGYDASNEAIAAVTQSKQHERMMAFVPKKTIGGLIFYPGGLVDHRAYASLMQELAGRGILCLLVEMPLDLAVLDMNAADGLQALYPEVDRWLIGGHSLGGAMAAGYLAEHDEEYEGLVLLGAYSTADLSGTALPVLSVYGSQDGVLNREKYAQCMSNYPQDFTEVVIDGGCHAFFGDYGAQKGDGEPSIQRSVQIEITADAIAAMLAE